MYKLQANRDMFTNVVKEPNVVIRLSDNAFIPFSEDNTDYAEYLRWLALGNTPLPAEENQ